ncbi:MAG TPA: (2Fe-2S)-binding protein [Acetobacteraceae bacterium]|nr:(2Fe-2S)-binding protein [Acetobacteraceae bacterium]
MRVPISLRVNGVPYAIEVEPRRTLADALRQDCGLTGTHIGCEHGVCGACTVIVDGEPVRACLMFAVQAEACDVRTIEGLALSINPSCEEKDGATLHPLQSAFIAHHGLQCGFCTPGFLMLAAAVLERDPGITDAALVDALSANLCRCTGYQGIVDAVLDAARTLRHAEKG